MISIKQAADIANKYLTDLVGSVEDVRLEEVESDAEHWFITLGYAATSPSPPWNSRIYKVFTVDKSTGEVSSMRSEMSKAFDPFAVLHSFDPKGLLLDTNLLVIYIVALVDKGLVGQVKRTENFLPEDADFLLRCVPRYARRCITPGIWAETSNLLESFFKSLPAHVLRWLQTAIREEIAILEEHWVPAKQFAHDDQLLRYGFTDLAIAAIAQNDLLVLTADLPLALLLQKRGLACVNYHTLRFRVL